MTERRTTTAPPSRVPDGSAVPARLRIVGWIVLATSLGLLAVVLTIRSALLTDVERSANADVIQEVDEFRTFAERGRDPQTGQPFASAERLLSLHLEREFPGRGEVLLAWVPAAEQAGRSPLLVQAVEDRFGLQADQQQLRGIVDGDAVAGTGTTRRGGDFRWGKGVVAGPDGAAAGAFVVAQFTEPAREEAESVVRLIAVVCAGGLLLTAGIAWAVAGQILAPVRSVRRAAARITRSDLAARIDVRGRDDVAALSHTFNAMMDRLEDAFRAQQRFASAAGSHLRGPLAVLADSTRDDADKADAVRRATAILDDLEVLAAGESPDFVDARPVDLRDLTLQLADDVRGLADRPWAVDGTADGTAVLDALRVRQAVLRLAVNALEHGGEAALRLGVRVDDGAVELWVADDGPGLAPERAARLLERYQDAPEHQSDRAGLGLAVVRAVADAHGGSAWVETAPGQGSVFGLRLPLGQPAPRDTPARERVVL